jgi:hypothetical protein
MYEANGESIIIENDEIEYKKYFLAGKEVDWDTFKKNRPEDRLNLEKLEKLKTIGHKNTAARSMKSNVVATKGK